MSQQALAPALRPWTLRPVALKRIVWPAAAAIWTLVWWGYLMAAGQHGDMTWYTADPLRPYGGNVAEPGSYLYSPAFLQLLSPLRLVPFEIMVWVWGVVMLASLAYAAGPWTPIAILLPPVMGELSMTNVHLLFAAAIALGFRWPAAWSLMLLTKVTPGIGLLWFAVRREWRNLGIALGFTALIAAASIVIAPDLWAQWFGLLTDGSRTAAPPFQLNAPVPIPLIVRLPIAAAIVIWGARTDRRWTVPVAVTLALPVIWTGALSILVAAIALRKRGPSAQPSS